MDNSFKNTQVLVTGADGFIGSHLVEALVAEGANVRAFTHYNSWNAIGWLSEISREFLSGIEIMPGDIRDADMVSKAIKDCSYVFHLASLVAIPYSYQAPRSYIETNIGGAHNIAQACVSSKNLKRLIHTSTSEVYGTAQKVPINEHHPLVAQSPYSASKIAADKIIESYYHSFQLPVVTARPFNTFGPRQTARAVIPTIASQLLSQCEELRLGSTTPTRDFVYVTDTAAALMLLAKCQELEGKAVNIGTGNEYSIRDIAHSLMRVIGHDCTIVSDDDRIRPEQSEVQRLISDSELLRKFTGWEPVIEFSEGIKLTVEWLSKNMDKFDPSNYSR